MGAPKVVIPPPPDPDEFLPPTPEAPTPSAALPGKIKKPKGLAAKQAAAAALGAGQFRSSSFGQIPLL